MAKAKAARTTPMMAAAPKPSEETPAKAETKEKKKKKSRFKLTVTVHVPDKIWIVGVMDTKDNCYVSIEHHNPKVLALYLGWLVEQCQNYACSVSVYSSDEEMDPVKMMVQVL